MLYLNTSETSIEPVFVSAVLEFKKLDKFSYVAQKEGLLQITFIDYYAYVPNVCARNTKIRTIIKVIFLSRTLKAKQGQKTTTHTYTFEYDNNNRTNYRG